MKYEFPPSYDLAITASGCPTDAETELMLDILENLWLKDRTLVSDGFDESLGYLQQFLPLEVIRTPSGTDVWTWTVPQKWSVNKAWLRQGDRIVCDYRRHLLHLASYSVPFTGRLTREELAPHLHSNPDRPEAIPYVTHYYRRDWSFCLSYRQVTLLGSGPFDVHIDTQFSDGHLSVGESTLEGQTQDCIILCSHLCHGGQVNDGLSGVAVGVALMRRLAELRERRYTYRLVLCPENIGSLCYLHARQLILPRCRYGIILEMLANKGHLKLQYSREGGTAIDRLAEHVLASTVPVFGTGNFRKVISNDEINFDGPGIGIPTVSLSRWPYPEYHTSEDSPAIVSRRYLKESVEVCWQLLLHLERNVFPTRRYTGNLFLSKFGLYEDLNADDTIERILLSFEGKQSVLEIAERLQLPLERVEDYVDRFEKAGLIDRCHEPR